ncbi:DUF6710 family protein [Thermoanaerobacter mathranii]|uniref:DUF6710 family protein n=1 Tax=Thermoanaerobacter mathranii TaxID=583357 RepID=UPI002FBE8906
MEATEYDVSKLFDHVYTDGLYWYNTHNNQKLEDDLLDFRIGIIYEISKIKHLCSMQGCFSIFSKPAGLLCFVFIMQDKAHSAQH